MTFIRWLSTKTVIGKRKMENAATILAKRQKAEAEQQKDEMQVEEQRDSIENFNPQLLKLYYGNACGVMGIICMLSHLYHYLILFLSNVAARLFPFETMYKWLCYGHGKYVNICPQFIQLLIFHVATYFTFATQHHLVIHFCAVLPLTDPSTRKESFIDPNFFLKREHSFTLVRTW